MSVADDDYVHVIGTSVNLDYKPDGGGPFPHDANEAYFSLLWQLTSETYSYRGSAPSVCLNLFADDASKVEFLESLDTLLSGVRSVLANPADQLHNIRRSVHIDDNEANDVAPPSTWTFIRAEYQEVPSPSSDNSKEKKNNATESLPSSTGASARSPDDRDATTMIRHDTVYNQTQGERNRERIALVYGNRSDADRRAYCDNFDAVPFADKALLIKTLINFVKSTHMNFRQFVYNESLAYHHYFLRYLTDHLQLLQKTEEYYAANGGVLEMAIDDDDDDDDDDDEAVIGEGGQVAMNSCRVRRIPQLLNASELRDSFGHTCVLRYRHTLDVSKVHISNDQRFILYLAIVREDNLFLSGPAGTGKSFLTRLLIKELELRDVTQSVTAMTGKASIIVGGTTFHRWAGVGLGKGTYEQVKANVYKYGGRSMETNAALRNWRQTSVLFVDESSMFGTPLFVKADKLGREFRGRANMLFGGIQLILVGDFCQLPPVYKRGEERPVWKYAFQTPQWRAGVEWQVELEKVYRQDDAEFIDLLNNTRKGKCTPAQRDFLVSRKIENLSDEEKQSELFLNATRLYPKKEQVATVNNREMAKVEGEERVFTWRLEYNNQVPLSQTQRASVLEYFHKNLAVDAEQRLKIGARVLCTANINDRIVNGSAGVVVRYERPNPAKLTAAQSDWKNREFPVVRFDECNEELLMLPRKWYRDVGSTKKRTAANGRNAPKRRRTSNGAVAADNDDDDDDDDDDEGEAEDEKWAAYVEQIPIQLGYAMTIHRCVAGNTLIATENGLQRICDLAKKYHVAPGTFEEVKFSVFGESGLVKTDQVFRGTTEKCLRITTERGFSIVASNRHPLRIVTSATNFDWKRAPEIQIGDALLMRQGTKAQGTAVRLDEGFERRADYNSTKPYNLPQFMSNELAELLGLLVGDGCVTDKKDGRVDVTCGNKESTDSFAAFSRELFEVSVTTKEEEKRILAYFHSRGVRDFLVHIGLDYLKAPHKYVPWSIFSGTVEHQASFLRGLFGTDGGVNGSGIHLTTSSQRLADEVQILLLNLGIISSRHEMGGPHKWRVMITARGDARTFADLISFRVAHKKASLEKRFPATNVASKKRKKSSSSAENDDDEHSVVYIPKSNRGAIPDGSEFLADILEELKQVYGRKYGKTTRLAFDAIGMAGRFTEIVRLKIGVTERHLDALVRIAPKAIGNALCPKFNRAVEWTKQGWFVEKVVKIEDHEAEMYDLHVPVDHSYVGQGFVNHNSQGMTLRSAIIGARFMFEKGQFYVAISRVKTPAGLYLDGLNMADLRVDPVVIRYYDELYDEKCRLFGSFASQPAPRQRAASTPSAVLQQDATRDANYAELRGNREFRLIFADLFRAYRQR